MSVKVVCIACPLGCRVTVDDGKITGHKCSKGMEYAYTEVNSPLRVYTGSVRITDGDLPVLAVRSLSGLPKSRMLEVAVLLEKMTLLAPVREGEVVVADVLGTGVDIVATRTVGRGLP
jgi:CxxC motif-containing protein